MEEIRLFILRTLKVEILAGTKFYRFVSLG